MKFALIGHPVAGSLSPRLFAAAYDGRYPYDLIDRECFEDAWTYEYGFNDDAVVFHIQETDKKKPTEIGKCISSNVIYWIEEDKRDQYMLNIRKGKVTIKEADLNDIGLSHLKRERAARERRHSWSF